MKTPGKSKRFEPSKWMEVVVPVLLVLLLLVLVAVLVIVALSSFGVFP